MNTALEARGLTKRYGDTIAVDDVDLRINKGEIFGLLGPNGAGKSSLLRMLYGSANVQSGELYILGLNAKNSFREIKARIGIVPQDDSLDSDFTVYENLKLFAKYNFFSEESAIQKSDELLREFQLDQFRNYEIEVLSGGNRKRLSIARSLINSPEMLFLDEPTIGLDPQMRIWIWEKLNTLRIEKKLSILISTHYMEEAEKMCDQVAVISSGKIVALGTPQNLMRENIGIEVVEIEVSQHDLGYYSNRLQSQNYKFQIVGRNINVHLEESGKSQNVLQFVHGKKVMIRPPNLNDVFLKLTGKKLDEPL